MRIEVPLDSKALLKLAAFFAKEEGTCLLYSGGNFDSATHSFLFLFPFEHIEIHDETNPWELLKQKIILDSFWVGFLTYEFGSKTVKQAIPAAYFQKSAFVLVFDHKNNRATLHLQLEALPFLSQETKEWMFKFSSQDFWHTFVHSLPDIVKTCGEPVKVVKDFETFDSYKEKVLGIQEMIRDGEVYQVNLSHEIVFLGKRDPYSLFYKLTEINPAPFSAYLNYKDFTIVSSSPERFLNKRANLLETRPIKGTTKRGHTEEEDEKNKQKLLHSTKEMAELLMITDLMRNDLGKISLPGSVKTLKVSYLEAYSNVYHLLSIIQSTPNPNLHPIDLVKSCFPGGSVTGCPKLASMKVIKQLEKRERGIYTGSIGYFSPGGDFDFNIAIRTLIFHGNEIKLQLGGAITIDSTPELEYEETMYKGDSIFQCLK